MNDRLWLEHKWRNRFHTAALLLGMTLMLAFSGWLLAGKLGVGLILIAGAVILFFSPRMSPLLILKMQRAQPLSHYQAGEIHQLAARLAQQAGLKRAPKIFWIPSEGLNAFALRLGPSRYGIAMTAGLLSQLSLRELNGVLAHEISHLKNNDTQVMHLAAVMNHMVNTLSSFAKLLLFLNLGLLILSGTSMNWFPLFLLALAPMGSTLLQLALSRTREFDADLGAAALTGDPMGLARALAKLNHHEKSIFEQIFLPNRHGNTWLQTHPASSERIRRLQNLTVAPSRQQPREESLFPSHFPTQVKRFKLRHYQQYFV